MKTIIRILVSIILLVYLFSKIELGSLKNTLANFNIIFYLCAICILSLQQFIWSYTWKITLSGKNIKVKTKDIFRAVLISSFFGTFLPSSIGPDIILAFNVGKSLKEKHHAPSSLLFIRLLHITGILLVSGIVLLFLPTRNFILAQILRLTWILLLTVWILYWLAIHPKSNKLVKKITDRFHFLNFIYKIFDSFSTFGSDNKITIKIWLLGVVMAFVRVLIDYTIALSLGIHIPYLWFLGLVPTISIISLLPISIAGLGVRESAYVALFSIIGIPPANSFSISIMLFGLSIWFCLIGGILYLIHGSHVKSKNI